MNFSLTTKLKYSSLIQCRVLFYGKRIPGIVKYVQEKSGMQRRWEQSYGAHIHDFFPTEPRGFTLYCLTRA